MSTIYRDKIGYLDYSESINFNNGKICPLDNFDKITSSIKEKTNEDGFFYPPIINTYRQFHKVVDGELQKREELIPKTKRPAHLFKMPPSHEIQITKPIYAEEPRKNDGLFITYLTAFLFGVRLQFHDWWFDGRVPVEVKQDFYIRHSDIEKLIELAYCTWRSSSEEEKGLLNNLLYMQTRIKSYEWDWEKFIIAYMVFDGCYRFLNLTSGVSSKTHKKRMQTVLKHFGMKSNQEWIDRFMKLRNDLFHETLWDGGQPCHSGSTYAYSAMTHLSKLNSRIIVSLLGYKGEYTKSPWWNLGTFAF
jgi:hypothetical protein